MGVDYFVYLGPRIEVQSNLTCKGVQKYRGCINSQCRLLEKHQSGNFCNQCGSSIEEITVEYDQEKDPYDVLKELGITTLFPDREDKDTTTFSFSYKESYSCDLKHEELDEDLSDLNIQEEIRKVEELFAKELQALEKAYGVKPVVKWVIQTTVG